MTPNDYVMLGCWKSILRIFTLQSNQTVPVMSALQRDAVTKINLSKTA